MVTLSNDAGMIRLNANRNAQRIVSPAMVIGLGSTSCQIARKLEATSENWSFEDRKNLAFLYMDTREATRGEISRAARFIPLVLPHFSNLRDMRPWITECVPELKYLSLSREGALGTLANAGVAGRFNYSDIRGHLDSTIEQICPYYEGITYLRIHVVAFLGGGTVGALPVLLAALSEVRGTAYNFSVVLHLLLPQRGMSAIRKPHILCSCAMPTLSCSSSGLSLGCRRAGASTLEATLLPSPYIPINALKRSVRTSTCASCTGHRRTPFRCREIT